MKIKPGSVLRFKFTSYGANGSPSVLTSPIISIYKDSSSSQTTDGVSVTVSFDGLAGLNQVSVNTAANPTFYSANSNFEAVITSGSVDGISVAGTVVQDFTIETNESLADKILSRGIQSIEDVAAEHSLTSVVLGQLEWSAFGDELTIYKTDGITPYLIKSINRGSSGPVTKIGSNVPWILATNIWNDSAKWVDGESWGD